MSVSLRYLFSDSRSLIRLTAIATRITGVSIQALVVYTGERRVTAPDAFFLLLSTG